jgi:hypothetical protein
LRQLTADYRATIREEARKRRFDIVDREDVLAQFGVESEENFILDSLHRGDEIQPALAAAMAAPIVARFVPGALQKPPAVPA